jgi:predicted nucleotidyltransferase
MIDLEPGHLETVRRILAAHVPGATVLAFGSRVRGTARPHSDLDLAVAAASPLPLAQLEALRDAFAASDLPMLVDVVDYHAVSAAFQRVIDAGCRCIDEERMPPAAGGLRPPDPPQG